MRISGRAHIDKLTDSELIDQYKSSGNKDLVGELYKRYAHLVYGLCIKYLQDEDESKDAVLQIFEKLMKDLKRHKVDHFKSWLYMVSKNFCLMELRKNKTNVRRIDEYKNHVEGSADPELVGAEQEAMEEKEMQLNKMHEALSCLKEEQKICVEMFYLKQQSYQEIADVTGYEVNKVKSYIQNGKRNLKLYLTNAKPMNVDRAVGK